MAGAIDNLSRREVLGGALGVPLASSFPRKRESSSPSPEDGRWIPDQVRNDGQWQRALAAYRSAEQAVEEAGRVCAAAPRHCSGQAPRAEVDAAEENFGDRLEELYDALRELLEAPAPELAALAVKIEAAFEHEVGTLAGTADGIAVLREDARLLCA